MNSVVVRAPVRADLAGGTLDLWPIYLFHPGARTVNVAISYYAESEIAETGDGAIEVHLTDQQYRQRYESMQELSADPKAALIYRALEHFHMTGLRITTRTDAPRGSGLGGSSALTVTLVRALSELAGTPFDGDNLVFLVRDLETRLLGVPAGIQDYYPPVFGGLAAIHLVPGVPVRHAITGTTVADLAQHMLIHYSGVAHFSGTNNWQMYKRQVEGKKKIQRGFAKIAATAVEMERALDAGDYKAAGKALAKEWTNRKALIDGISTPEIDQAIDAALSAGAWGGKVCGAGGGGCIVFLFPPDTREAIVDALSKVPGRVLDAVPVQNGLTVRRGDEGQAAGAATRPRLAVGQTDGKVEQLYVHGGRAEYKPFLLAEGLITYSEPRSEFHQTVSRTFYAPFDTGDVRVRWQEAKSIDPDRLDIRAVPDPDRRIDATVSAEALVQAALHAEEGFKQFLSESERLRIFQNPALNLNSQPNETREAFAARCAEETQRQLSLEAERLESTFRRRIDQLREKSEREERDREGDPSSPHEPKAQEVNVAWGQALYNITSGRPAAVADADPSVREIDYLENIAQIQKAWDRELQTLREALTAKAQEIEELQIAPSPKNIEIAKYVILWTRPL
jgi:D-glycero-alpha-D-manno-heptose-7-phosphate kinase